MGTVLFIALLVVALAIVLTVIPLYILVGNKVAKPVIATLNGVTLLLLFGVPKTYEETYENGHAIVIKNWPGLCKVFWPFFFIAYFLFISLAGVVFLIRLLFRGAIAWGRLVKSGWNADNK